MWICYRCSFFLNFYYSGVDPLPRERGATLLHVGGWGMDVGGIHTHVGGWHTIYMWICYRCSFVSNFYYSGVDPLSRERGATFLLVGGWGMGVGGIHTHVGGWHTIYMWICYRCSFFLNFYYGVD